MRSLLLALALLTGCVYAGPYGPVDSYSYSYPYGYYYYPYAYPYSYVYPPVYDGVIIGGRFAPRG